MGLKRVASAPIVCIWIAKSALFSDNYCFVRANMEVRRFTASNLSSDGRSREYFQLEVLRQEMSNGGFEGFTTSTPSGCWTVSV